MAESLHSIAKMIDHSLLHPTLTDQELTEGCKLALRLDVASVCIKPYAVPLAKDLLAGAEVKVGAVVGFPHGSNRVEVKLREAELALADGAAELDMVVNIGKVRSQDWTYVTNEVRALNDLAVRNGAILKVIFETDFLTDATLKSRLCMICNANRVAFAKTSTGYGFVKQENGMYSYAGATDSDVALMRKECISSIQIKAAGGIRTLDDLLRVRALGATRVGATATEAILAQARERGYE
jgi:deoxyribose-phosphate aldolase